VSCPTSLDLCRVRGDTFPFTVTLTDGAGAAIDITGSSFTLTVDPSPAPSGSANNLFSVAGVLSDPVNGEVTFTLSWTDADQTPNTYYYDIQWTASGGAVRTILKGKWVVQQDITK